MRFLLISDPHGKIGIINELPGRTQADAVVFQVGMIVVSLPADSQCFGRGLRWRLWVL